MSEKVDYQTLRKHLGKCHLERIENIVGVGTPDVYYCIDGEMGWIEIKSPIEPERMTSRLLTKHRHQFGQNQKNWFLSHRNAGGRAFILLCTDKCWMLIDGKDAEMVNDLSVNHLLEIAVWTANKPFAFPMWSLLRMKLKGD